MSTFQSPVVGGRHEVTDTFTWTPWLILATVRVEVNMPKWVNPTKAFVNENVNHQCAKNVSL